MLVHLEQIVLFCLKALKTSLTTYHYNIWDILHVQTHDAMIPKDQEGKYKTEAIWHQ